MLRYCNYSAGNIWIYAVVAVHALVPRALGEQLAMVGSRCDTEQLLHLGQYTDLSNAATVCFQKVCLKHSDMLKLILPVIVYIHSTV